MIRTTLTRVFALSLAALLTCSAVALGAADSLPSSTPESVGMSSERLDRIVPAMQRLVDEGKIPGTVTMVARRGQIVHFEAIGLQNVEKGEPMTKDTIFRMYSQSKPITGVATMILFEEGKFLLSDPVSLYLPEYKDMKVLVSMEKGEMKTEKAQPIRIHHLLTHTAGLSYGFFPNPVGQSYNRAQIDSSESLAAWSQELGKLPLLAQPGTEWNYSVAMDVLGRLIEVVSGQSFGEFLEERIFEPLGMQDTAFWVPEEKRARFAANYGPTSDGKMRLVDDPASSTYLAPPKIEMGGAGLVSTAADYIRFAQMLANSGELDGVRMLGPKTVDLMMSNHLGPGFPPDPLTSLFGMMSPGSSRVFGVGFGLTGSVTIDPALTGLPGSVGTFAWGGAASTDFWVDREEELVGMVLTQLLPAGTYPTRQLMQLLTYQAIIE